MPHADHPPSRRALVAGGTGLVGSELLALLAEDPRYSDVVSLVRRPSPPQGSVRPLVVSFDELAQQELPAADDAYCCLGTTRKKAGSDAAFTRVDLDYVLAFAEAAKRAGASRFLLVSSLGADPDSKLLYPRVKGQAELRLREFGFSVLGLLRPSVLVGQRSEARAGEAVALAFGRVIAPLMRGRLRRYRPIAASTVARGLVRLAFEAEPGVHVIPSEAIDHAP